MPAAEPTVFERLAPDPRLVDEALAGTRDAVFWTENVEVERFGSLSGPHHADLAVVGGGYTGLWTAVRAKQRDPGRRVVLLEGRRLGWAASGRNGGFCAASLTHGEENGRARWPEEYDELERLGRENLAGIERTVADFEMPVDFEPTGELSVAVEPHQVDWLRAARTGRFLDQAAVRSEVASPTYLAGLERDDVALLHPAKLVRELARVATGLGVEIFENTHVEGIGSDGGIVLETPDGSVVADRVALGTNAFPALVRRFRAFTVPVYDYAVITDPLTAEQRRALGWSRRQGIADLANQFHYYRLSGDDRLLFGGYDAVYAGRRVRGLDGRATHRRLVSHLLTTFPQLAGVRVSHAWGGAIDTSTRFAVVFGRARGGRVAHAAGFTGLGVGASRFAADVLLDLLDGLDTERTRLEMVRRPSVPFPPEPLTRAGIGLTRWSLDRADHRQGRRNQWLRSLDRLGLGFDS